MSRHNEHSIDELLTPDEREELGEFRGLHELPEAEVVEWEGGTVVTTPGFSIASSMNRFTKGNLMDIGQEIFEGFHGDFTDGKNYVAFVDPDVIDVLGEEAVVRVPEIGRTMPVDLRPPEDALDTVRKYEEKYSGPVEDDFMDRINSRNAVVPVLYNHGGVIPETQMALMESEGVLTSDRGLSPEAMLHDDELGTETGRNDIQIEGYKAPEDADAEYFVEVLPQDGHQDVDYNVFNRSFTVDVDGEKALEDLPGHYEVEEFEENNGLYIFELH